MSDLQDDEKEMLIRNRLQTFRLYHTRTLGTVLKLLREKKSKDAQEYIKAEIYSITKIKNSEFGQLIDALTLKMKLNEKGNNDKTNSGS